MKEKSLERKSGKQANDATHHSQYAPGITITVCGPITGPDQFDNACAVGVAGGNGTWSECTWTSDACSGALLMSFNILQHHTITNTCDNSTTQDGASYNYSGNMCVSVDGGNTWTSATWVDDHYEVILSNPGENTTTTVNYSTTCDANGAIGATSTISVPTCVTGEGGCDPNDQSKWVIICTGEGEVEPGGVIMCHGVTNGAYPLSFHIQDGCGGLVSGNCANMVITLKADDGKPASDPTGDYNDGQFQLHQTNGVETDAQCQRQATQFHFNVDGGSNVGQVPADHPVLENVEFFLNGQHIDVISGNLQGPTLILDTDQSHCQ